MSSTLACYDAAIIMVVKSFIVKAQNRKILSPQRPIQSSFYDCNLLANTDKAEKLTSDKHSSL